MRAMLVSVDATKSIGGDFRGRGTFTVLVLDYDVGDIIAGAERSLGPSWKVDEIRLLEHVESPRSFIVDTLMSNHVRA